MYRLGTLKARAHLQIDEAAGRARMRYITDVAGQQAVYLLKKDEAAKFLLDGTVGPHLAAEAAALGVSVQQVADTVSATSVAWAQVLSPSIEAARMAGKAAVTAAQDADGVAAALAAAESTLDGI